MDALKNLTGVAAALRAALGAACCAARRCRGHRPVRRCAPSCPATRSCCANAARCRWRCRRAMRPMPAQGATVGCGVGTVSLWLAAGSTGIALQVRRAILPPGRVLSTLWQREPCPMTCRNSLLTVPLHRNVCASAATTRRWSLPGRWRARWMCRVRHDVLQRLRAPGANRTRCISRRRNVRGAFALREGVELPRMWRFSTT
jgi:hypothetical protein